jgi:integrase
MSNSVAAAARRTPGFHAERGLYTRCAERKYINAGERVRVIAASTRLAPERALFVATLVWTGARVSEVLALTPAAFQIERRVVAIRTLKRRCFSVREVPIPPALMQALDQCFDLVAAQRDETNAHKRLWSFCRATAWRIVTYVMIAAGVSGRAACPRGLRHGFGVGTLHAGVPVTLVQRWLGHARLSTTAIYAEVSGPEEDAFAQRYWRSMPGSARPRLQ